MELKECITCGSHSFTDNKCDYCGNEYKSTEYYADGAEAYAPKKETWQEKLKVAPLSDYMKSLSDEETNEIYRNLKDGLTPNQIRTATCKEDLVKETELNQILDSFDDKKGNELAFKIMVWILISIIWFAVTVFIPPLFLITIADLMILITVKIIKKIRV